MNCILMSLLLMPLPCVIINSIAAGKQFIADLVRGLHQNRRSVILAPNVRWVEAPALPRAYEQEGANQLHHYCTRHRAYHLCVLGPATCHLYTDHHHSSKH